MRYLRAAFCAILCTCAVPASSWASSPVDTLDSPSTSNWSSQLAESWNGQLARDWNGQLEGNSGSALAGHLDRSRPTGWDRESFTEKGSGQMANWQIARAVQKTAFSDSSSTANWPASPIIRAAAGQSPWAPRTSSKAQPPASENMEGLKASDTPGLATQAIGLSLLAVVPFLLMLVTPFAKFAMVFSLLRNALGVQQVPPNQVVNGVSVILSLFVMFPVGLQMYEKASDFMTGEPPPSLSSDQMPQYILKIANECKEPLRLFLRKNTAPTHIKNFYKIALRMSSEERYRSLVQSEDFIVLVPAYITSQVKSGFEIGTLIFLPFFVVDLVVSNILLAMGMMMLSPVTISMPLKIFLLVMLDGWTLLTDGLINSYK